MPPSQDYGLAAVLEGVEGKYTMKLACDTVALCDCIKVACK